MIARVLKTVVVVLVGAGAALALALAVEASRQFPVDRPGGLEPAHPIRLMALEGSVPAYSPVVDESAIEGDDDDGLAPQPGPRRIHRRVRRATVTEAPAPLPEAADAFRFALRGAREAFERCYDAGLHAQPDLDGSFLVSVQVSARGQVETARVVHVRREALGVAACITSRLRSLKLPPLREGAELVLPIHLEKAGRPGWAPPSPTLSPTRRSTRT